jgi:hypothetical protein
MSWRLGMHPVVSSFRAALSDEQKADAFQQF